MILLYVNYTSGMPQIKKKKKISDNVKRELFSKIVMDLKK